MLSSKYISSIVFFILFRLHQCNSLAIERSAVIPEPTVPKSQLNGTHANTNHCGFTGDSDLYGIGIRLGYYTQALSVWFANYFVLSEAKVLRSMNLLFLVALFIALVWLSHQSQKTYAVEIFLLLRLLFATWYVGVLDRSRFSKKHGRQRIMRVVVRECALLGMLSYTVWFTWIGLDQMEKTPCGTWIFFATKLNLYGTYRSAYKVLSISALCFGTIKQCGTASQLFQHWRDTGIRSPDYFARLGQALLVEDYNNNIARGNSCKEQHAPVGSDEVGHTVRSSESGASSLPHSTVLMRDDMDEGASVRSARVNESEHHESYIPRQNVSDAATQCHLPDTPPHPPKNPSATSQNGSPAGHTPNLEALPSLESLIEGDRWLGSIIAVDVAEHSAWCYQVPGLPLKVFLPTVHSPRAIRRRLSALYALRPLRPSILVPLARHVKSLRRFGLYSYPIMLEAALRHPYHKCISRPTLLATVALHKARLPANRPTPHVVWSACASLAMWVELVLSIELSIHWNRIGGMGNMGAPGQLIPAIIGIGGLVRVVWVWWGRDGAVEQEDDEVGKGLRECVEVYQRLKNEREDLEKEPVASTVAAEA